MSKFLGPPYVEAATFYLRDCFENLPGTGIVIRSCTAAGGGSQSEAWVQLSADILGLPFERLQVHEAGALGAAILAGVGSGHFVSMAAAVEAMVHRKDRFEPDAGRKIVYDERFARYREFAALMEKTIRELQ